MKKAGTVALVMVTIAFLAFTVGLFIGRNYLKTPSLAQTEFDAATETSSVSVTHIEQTNGAERFKLDINTATQAELEQLPGIGPVLAQRILEYREANGVFTSISELGNVEGIGSGKLIEILEWITVEGQG